MKTISTKDLELHIVINGKDEQIHNPNNDIDTVRHIFRKYGKDIMFSKCRVYASVLGREVDIPIYNDISYIYKVLQNCVDKWNKFYTLPRMRVSII